MMMMMMIIIIAAAAAVVVLMTREKSCAPTRTARAAATTRSADFPIEFERIFQIDIKLISQIKLLHLDASADDAALAAVSRK